MRASRRVVTVVFADLVGFTTLSERLDSEDVAAIQRAYFARARESLVRHGGLVEKYNGDAVVGSFGVARAQDDDADRAVRAALDIVAAVARLAETFGLTQDELQVRVGVNTGEVLITGHDATGWQLTGVVNVTARLQSNARPGSVRCSSVARWSCAHLTTWATRLRRGLKLGHAQLRAAHLEDAMRTFARLGDLAPDRSPELVPAALGYEDALFASRLPRGQWGDAGAELVRRALAAAPDDAARARLLASVGRADIFGGDPEQGHRSIGAILQREWGFVIGLLAGLGEDDWGLPTRLEGWTIRDLARHVVWGVSMEAEALRRARAGETEAEAADGHTMGPESAPAQILDGLGQAVADLLAETEALRPDAGPTTCPMPHGATPLPVALDVFVFEAGIHASDFADAVGEDRPLAEDVVPRTEAVLALFLPAFAAAGAAPPEGTSFSLRGGTVALDGEWSGSGLVLGAAVAEPTFAVLGDDSSVLLFANGRLGPADPRLRVEGSHDLAAGFKTCIPGP